MGRRTYRRRTGEISIATENKGNRRNHEIRVPRVRVIGADGEQVGILDRDEALGMAEEAGLDLVEIQPNADPPVCRVMDFGKYKFEQQKKDRKSTRLNSSHPSISYAVFCLKKKKKKKTK